MKLFPLIALLPLVSCGNGNPVSLPDAWQVSHSGKGAYEAGVAVNPEGATAIAWYDERDGNAEIYLSLYDPDFNPVLLERRMTYSAAQSYEADVAWIGDNIAIAWYDVTDSGASVVKAGLWDHELNVLWEKDLTSGNNGRIPELIGVNDRLFIAWVEQIGHPRDGSSWSDIRGAWLEASGEFSAEPFFIASASETTWNLNSAATGEHVVALVYDAGHETRSNELYLTLVFQTTPVTRRLSVDDNISSKYPDIDFRGTTAAISWHDERDGNQEIYLEILELAPLLESGREAEAFDIGRTSLRVSDTPGDSFGAYLAWRGDILGLAWCDNTTGHSEIFFSTFSPEGLPIGNAARLTSTEPDSLIPALEARNGEYIVAWNEAVIDGHGTATNNTRSEIHARRLY